MALLFTDGFDVGDFTLKYSPFSASNFISSSTTTRYSSGRCVSGISNGNHLLVPLPVSNKLFIGIALKDTVAVTKSLFEFLGDTRVTSHIILQLNVGRTLSLLRGGVTLASSTAILDTNWHFLEISCSINDTTGTCEVRLDGTQIITFTGDTKNAGTNTTIDGVKLFVNSGQSVDDLYIFDDTGSTNNTFTGEIRIQTLSPNGAGSATQFTATPTAANYTTVNEIPYSTANFVSSSTVGHQDLYTLSDLLAGTASVLAVQTNLIANKSDAGTGNIKTIVKSGATTYSDPVVTLSASASHYYKARDTDPATSTSWTIPGVNSLEAGIENV